MHDNGNLGSGRGSGSLSLGPAAKATDKTGSQPRTAALCYECSGEMFSADQAWPTIMCVVDIELQSLLV